MARDNFDVIEDYIAEGRPIDQDLLNRFIVTKLSDIDRVVGEVEVHLREQNGTIREMKQYQIDHPSMVWLLRHRLKTTLGYIAFILTFWMLLWSPLLVPEMRRMVLASLGIALQ